ncbi:DUF805 domain-containing protein [Pseudomonas sp. B6002]|uniref:DUF805 domain-containing protein n=1 Tax=Pseudomonas sp. B6002 TaxID=2726978 RepID=UPI0015A22A37|nr:DUF805 domain-containing protein [Pseudomonas sp. B6002]NVZ53759.1 DUF805 domain-containing protein [Pseudomonas sp. B6002]
MTCWVILGIEPTTDSDLIRGAYRARLPAFHPERDPSGFQALRGAYESALALAHEMLLDRDTHSRVQEEAELQAMGSFDALLEDSTQRYDVEAWKVFMLQLDKLPLEALQSVSLRLLSELIEIRHVPHACAQLLANRLGWSGLLLEVDFDSANRIDQFLQRIQRPDPFDLTMMGKWPAPVQLEVLWYIRHLDYLSLHRPLDEYCEFANLHTCLPLPSDPTLICRLLAQFTHAGIGGRGLREAIIERHPQMPDDPDSLYLAATQNGLLGLEEQALQGWVALWRQFQHPKAAVWLLALCARHQPQRLPLLIQAFDCQALSLDLVQEQRDIDEALASPGMRAETLARWYNASHDRLPGVAGAYVKWVTGGDSQPLFARLRDGQAEADLLRFYRHAWALHEGDLKQLQQVLEQEPIVGVLDELILEGFRHQARQRIDRLSAMRNSPEPEALPAANVGRSLEPVSPWAFWCFGSRLGRRAFTGQVATGLALGVYGVWSIPAAPVLSITLLAFVLFLLAGAVLRRLHDMGRGLPTLMLGIVLTAIVPFFPLLLCLWPGDSLPNRFGRPPGKAEATVAGD